MPKLDFQEDPICDLARRLTKAQFDNQRARGLLSKVHDLDHVTAVSNFGGVTARALMNGQGYDDIAYRASVLAAIAGNLHDFEREAKETEPHGPRSADFFNYLASESSIFDLDFLETASVYRAIANHEMSLPELLEEFSNPIGPKKEKLPAVVAFSLKTGDGILEASGYRVLERRAFFVGKERMLHGDLKNIFQYPGESDLAVIGETLRRLYGKLPIDSYPEWIKEYGEKLHSIQYLFLRGLLRYRGMSETEAAECMEEAGFPKFDGIADKVHAQKHLDGEHFSEDRYPVLATKISQLRDLGVGDKDELAEASYKLVETIAQSESPEEGIDTYSKFSILTNTYAHDFYNGMNGYREGSDAFIDDFETNVTDAVRRISSN